MVKVKDKATVGVPASKPAGVSVRPVGSVPDTTEKLRGAVPPCAPIVWEYGAPVRLGGSEAVVMVSASEVTTV